MKRMFWALGGLPLVALAAMAGGFFIQLGSPAALPDGAGAGGVMVARLDGCGHPERGSIEATAEGLVNGTRRTVAVPAMKLKDGQYLIRRSWPEEGRWVVKLVASHPEISAKTFLLVPVKGDSFERGGVAREMRVPAEADVVQALNR